MQKTIAIKTFSNGDKLTYRPAIGGIGELQINGNRADYRPLIKQKRHNTGVMIAAVLLCKGQTYCLTPDDLEAIVAANVHYVPTLIDRICAIRQLEDNLKICRAEVGSAHTAAVEHLRTHGVPYSTRDAHQAELDAVTAAETELEAAKKADPEAWTKLQDDRRQAMKRAMNH